MPKFEKGSQEAKDYMANLRAKRMSGGGMRLPPKDDKVWRSEERIEEWDTRFPEQQRNLQQQQQQANIQQLGVRELDELLARIQEARRVLEERERRRVLEERGGGKITIRPPPKQLPISMRPKISRPSPPPLVEGTGLMSDIVGTVKKTAKKTRQIINKTAQSVKTVAQGGRDDYPPSVRKLLKNNGEKKIVSAIINRKPVEKKLSGLLNVLSLGQFKKNIENEPYDDLFHLSIVLRTEDGKDILVEKNEVINMAMKGRKGGETLPIAPFQGGKTLNEIMENTKKRMGGKFFGYSARNNNCQDFIMALLQSNGMGDANDFTFVKQDAKQMFKGLGTLSKVADFITDLGGATNVLIKGTGAAASFPVNQALDIIAAGDEADEDDPEVNRDILIDEEDEILDNIKEKVYKKMAGLINRIGKRKVKRFITDEALQQKADEIINEEMDKVFEYYNQNRGNPFPADIFGEMTDIPFYTGDKWREFVALMNQIKLQGRD